MIREATTKLDSDVGGLAPSAIPSLSVQILAAFYHCEVGAFDLRS